MIICEPAPAYGKYNYSIPEYLEMEDAATEKHEYYRGEVFAMSGGTVSHSAIGGNIYHSLRGKLNGTPCKPFNSDMRIHIEKNTLFTYPDVSVICGNILTLNDDNQNVLNPTVIFEVLSPTTKRYDLVEKFRLYQDIASLNEYVIVDSERPDVRIWNNTTSNGWLLTVYQNIEESIELQSLNISMTLKEIYESIFDA